MTRAALYVSQDPRTGDWDCMLETPLGYTLCVSGCYPNKPAAVSYASQRAVRDSLVFAGERPYPAELTNALPAEGLSHGRP